MKFGSLVSTQRRYYSIVLLVVALGTSLVAGASAQAAQTTTETEESMAITPATQQFETKSGAVLSGTMTVINDGEFKYDFIVYARPYSVKNEKYDPQFEKTSKNTAVYQWIRFEKVAYTLEPGERIEVPYDINVPAGAASGGHYGVIFAETQPDPDAPSSVVRKKRVGSIVSVNVEGNVTRSGALVSAAADFWQTSPPLSVSNRVENSGNTDFKAKVVTTVTDMFGSAKHSESKEYVVYPGTIRNITFEWTKSPWFGLFRANQTVTVLDKVTDKSYFVLLAPRWLALILITLIIAGVSYGFLHKKQR